MAVDCTTGTRVPPATPNPVTNLLVGRRGQVRGTGPWTGLDMSEVRGRLGELVTDPDLLSQGCLNLSGPAAFVRAWIRRDPVAFTDFALELSGTGRSSIGGYEVDPRGNGCVASDHRALRLEHGPAVPPGADWLLLSAMRDAESLAFDYSGDPEDDISALTTPGALSGWLAATGRWATVREEVGPQVRNRLGHARSLRPTPESAVLVLVNAALLLPAGNDSVEGRVLGSFPYHWLALESPVVDVPGGVRLTSWSFGRPAPHRSVTVPTAAFEQHYYGAVIAS